MHDAELKLNIKVGPDDLKLTKKSQNGVPVLVDPVIAKPTGAETVKLGHDLKVGPDELSVAQKATKLA